MLPRRTALFAAASLAAWNAAFLLLPRLSIWEAVGAAATLLTALALAHGAPWRELLAPRPRALRAGLLAAVGLIAASEVLYPPLAGAWPALREQARMLYALFGHPAPLTAYLVLPIIAAAEELIFRGALYSGLAARLPAHRAALGALLVYTAAHLAAPGWALPLLAAGCGALWTLLRAATGSLWPPLLCHVVWDVVVLSVAPLER